MFSRKLSLIAFVLLFIAAYPAAAQQCPAPGSLAFTAALAGNQFGGAGSERAFGTGAFTIDPATGQGTFNLTAAGLSGNITRAALFERTNATTPVLTLTDFNNTFRDGRFERTLTIPQPLLAQILANPSNFTFRIDTSDFPSGAITGQLAARRSFAGTLSGTSIVGTPGAATAGGAFTADIVPAATGTGSVLNFSFVPTGIGNEITGLELRSGAAGVNGPLVATLSGPATLTGGRLTGSVNLTQEQAQQLMTNPNAFNVVASTAAFPSGAARAQFGAVQNELFIPVAGRVTGAGGSRWETDVHIFNTSWTTPATVTLQYLASGPAGNLNAGTISPARSVTVSVAPRSTNFLPELMHSIFGFGLQASSLGAIRLVSDQPIAATARIYNDRRDEGRGLLGQTVPALTWCDALTRGVIPGLNVTTAARTNVGFFNPNATPVTIRLNLGTPNHTDLADTTWTLAPFGHVQLALAGSGGLFGDLTVVQIANAALTFHASAPVIAYGSIVDNASGDVDLVIAQPDQSAPPM